MRILHLGFIFVLCMAVVALAENQGLLIDDFESPLYGGPDGTVDFGAGNGSSIEISAANDIKYLGEQSIKVIYNAVPGGYMWLARGFDLDAKNAQWPIKPLDIDWAKYKAISFYMYGSDSKAKIAFDIKDNGNEFWRFMAEDNFKGWKQIVCPFNEFFVRADWQPSNADKNATLDFPLKSFQFEPRPEAKGTVYFDEVRLMDK